MISNMSFGLSTTMVIGLSFASLADAEESGAVAAIRDALTFSASFDTGPDADFAKGDKRIYFASSGERKDSQPGLPAGEVEVAKGQGRHGGDALRFIRKSKVIFYKAAGNVDYRQQGWSGAASFWLSLDPEADLGDAFCDPIQITEKAFNDGGLWVDFTKDEKPKHFRLGALPDLTAWNPTKRDFLKLTAKELPLFVVTRHPFGRGKWTHVAVTFENFNTGKPDGVAKLYLNGKLQGAVSGWNQTYTWNLEKTAIQIGMGYIGLYDDLSLFRRALSEAEIQALYVHEGRLAVPN